MGLSLVKGTMPSLAEKQGITPNKGSLTNNVSHATEQMINIKKGQAKDVVTLSAGAAASVAAAGTVAKSKKAQEFLKTGFDKIANSSFGKTTKEVCSEIANSKYVKKSVDWVKNLPKPAKAVLAAGAAVTGLVLSNNHYKTGIKAGQIDQKYTDKAKVDKILA